MKEKLQEAFEKCTSCRETGRPTNSRKISFSRILSEFNYTVQVDYFFTTELSKTPILHVVSVSTGYSAPKLALSREMDKAMEALEEIWINLHGPPSFLSTDVEFLNKFAEELKYFGIMFKAHPARRHNKLGVVERKNSVVRLLFQRLLKDAKDAVNRRNVHIHHAELISRATFLSNLIFGGKLLSSF